MHRRRHWSRIARPCSTGISNSGLVSCARTSLAAFLAEAGWENENELMLAVWRDYLFNRISK